MALFFLMGVVSLEQGSLSLPRVDSLFVHLALEFLQKSDEEPVTKMIETNAASHLAAHAKRVSMTGTGPSASTLTQRILNEMVEDNVDPQALGARLARVEKDPDAQVRCWQEAGAYLPEDALSDTVLYLTVGYDIGVAVSGEAGLNLAHPHFVDNPEEIWFYCVHEIHHAGFQKYHDLPALSDVKTTSDLVDLFRYLTTLEGLAVHAARGWRKEAGALRADGDYVALLDPELMEEYESEFFKLYLDLVETAPRPLEEEDWEIVNRMSSGNRLWYRVGARMAEQLELELGRDVLIETIVEGPDAFFSRYAAIAE